jgi:hypothetical protein
VANWEQWWLIGSSGGSLGAVAAHGSSDSSWEQRLLLGSSGGSLVATPDCETTVATPDCETTVLG